MSNPIDALQAARAATTELTASEQRLRDEHGEAVRAVSDVRNAWPPADEIVDNMRRLMGRKTAQETDERWRTIVQAFAGDSKLKMDGTYSDIRPAVPRFGDNNITLPLFAMLAPDLLTEAFERIIRTHAPAEGVPSTDRAERIREAEANVRAIEDRHEQLVDEAAAAGIVMSHLPAVQQRRDEAAAKAKREQEAKDARRQAEQSVNTMRGYSSQVKPAPDQGNGIASPWSNG